MMQDLLPFSKQKICNIKNLGENHFCGIAITSAHSAAKVFIVTEIQTMLEIAECITVNPVQCSGCLCVHGMRIRVFDVLNLLANCGYLYSTTARVSRYSEEPDIMAYLHFAKPPFWIALKSLG